MDIQSLLVSRALILVPALYIIGEFLKHTPVVKSWCVPWILLAAGVLGAVGMFGLTEDAVIQGVLAAGAAVLGQQLLKEIK